MNAASEHCNINQRERFKYADGAHEFIGGEDIVDDAYVLEHGFHVARPQGLGDWLEGNVRLHLHEHVKVDGLSTRLKEVRVSVEDYDSLVAVTERHRVTSRPAGLVLGL